MQRISAKLNWRIAVAENSNDLSIHNTTNALYNFVMKVQHFDEYKLHKLLVGSNSFLLISFFYYLVRVTQFSTLVFLNVDARLTWVARWC